MEQLSWVDLGLIVFCLCSIIAALGVLWTKIPVVGAINLLLMMVFLAGIYALLGSHLLAAFQIILYAGAITVLLIYMIMLLDDQQHPFKISWIASSTVFIVVATLMFLIWNLLMNQQMKMGSLSHESYGSVERVALKLFSDYLVPFELSSILLLLAMIGAIALAKKGEH